ncbi:MAG TPA: hypothetical protein VHM67_09600 [Gemmatimonadaceae bacterium]|nr:hypothetical protein [Gemmatimonadaceae bacterium]
MITADDLCTDSAFVCPERDLLHARWGRAIAIGLAAGALACAAAQATSRREGHARPETQVIDASEIRPHHATAYDVVAGRRPDFLRSRGATVALSAGDAESTERVRVLGPLVYLDGVRLGGPEHLRWIRASEVLEIRHLGAIEAAVHLGPGHESGAIMVITRRR